MPDKPFSQERRIRKRAEYDRVFGSGRKIVTPFLVVFVHRAPGSRARLGLAVSKKMGKAVKRNRIKRQIREAFRQVQNELPPLDMVVIPRQRLRDQPYDVLVRSFAELIRVLRRGEGQAGST